MEGAFFKLEESDYSYPVLFFVEGQDDAILLDIILTKLEVARATARIIVCKGKSGFGNHLPLLLKSIGFGSRVKSVAIIRDADDDPDKAQEEVHKDLLKNGLPKPEVSKFIDHDGKRFGLYLFPKQGQSGDLEALALSLAPPSQTLDDSIAYIDGVAARVRDLTKISKRKTQAYLSGASAEIRPTIGWAFKDGTIPISLDSVPELVAFIRDMLANA